MSPEDIYKMNKSSHSEKYVNFKTKEEKDMNQNDTKSSMKIVVDDEQEITFNFFDISNITKKGYKNDSNTGERYVIVGVGYNRKASSTVPMKEHDYSELVNRFTAFVENMGNHPENQQLRAINAVMADQISDIIKNSVSEHIEAKNNIEEQMLTLQEQFGKQLEAYTKKAAERLERSQKDLDDRLASVEQLYQKLSKVTSLVDDFLVAEETLEQEETH